MFFSKWCLLLLVNISLSFAAEPPEDDQTRISRAQNRLKMQAVEFYNLMSTHSIGHDFTTDESFEKHGCGLTADDQRKVLSIRNGTDAFPYKWPWAVALYKESAVGWHCGAVLVDRETILTAAHCVVNMTAEEVKPVLGAHTLVKDLNVMNYRTVRAIHRHPKYKDCCEHDVAILKLTKPVVYGPRVNRACLPFPSSKFSLEPNEIVNVIGWGRTEKGLNRTSETKHKLQEGTLKIFNDALCRKDHGSAFRPRTEFCAGDYQNQTDTMQGDSGGPLLIRTPKINGRWTVFGLTSYKSDTATGATGVYTKLTAFESFIRSHLSKET